MCLICVLLSMKHSLGQLERWNATAHSIPPEDPLFCTIKALLETTDEGKRTTGVLGVILKPPTDIKNRHLEEDSLRRKLDNVNKAVESFVSSHFGNAERGFVY